MGLGHDARGGRKRAVSLRAQVKEAVEQGRLEALELLVAREPRAVRFLLGLSYRPEAEVRAAAAAGIGFAARHHPRLVQGVARRLVWAMNDESGTNALTAPEVLQAVARERPKLLLPLVPDLVRLAGDAGLHQGLSETLRILSALCPGQVGERLEQELNKRLFEGDSGEDPDAA
jgi:hypothetical protein